MTIVNEEVVRDLELAREVLSTTDCSIVVINYGKIWKKKTGEGIRPIMETIEEMGEDIHGSIIGDRILGKASAFLWRYSKIRGIYSPQATKTAIAILIIGGIPCQADEMIPFIVNNNSNYLSSFEKMLQNVESPEEAYKILKGNVIMD